MAKKETKKVVDVCKKCGSEPCSCVKEEAVVEDYGTKIMADGTKYKILAITKQNINDSLIIKNYEDYGTKIMADGTKYKILADGTEELIK